MNSYRKAPGAAGTPNGILGKIISSDFIRNLRSLLGLPKRSNGSQPSLQSLFSYYRKVLESCNRAVGIISEMNKSIGGDRPADIEYVESAYAELHEAVDTAVKSFNIFTHYRYGNLHEVFNRIDRQISQTIKDVISGDLPVYAHSHASKPSVAVTRDQEKNILRHIARLNLVDPMFDDFTTDNCKTIYDIIRFMHVKSVQQLAESRRENQHPVHDRFSPAMH